MSVENLSRQIANLATSGLSVTNTSALPVAEPVTITSINADALAVGPAGTTNPTLQVDASTASAATGVKIKSAAAAGGCAVSVVSSGTNENLTIDAKGSGTVTINGTATGRITLGQQAIHTSADAITAHAGGGQASATALTAKLNRITTVAALGDSVALPAAVAGLEVIVMNAAAANACDIFPNGTDTINALAASTAVRINAGTLVMFGCTVAGKWQSSLIRPAPAKYTKNTTAGATTAAAGDLTGAAFVSAEYSAVGTANLTTRTATQMFNDAGNVQPGDSYTLQITNSSGGTTTLAAGTGVTLTGTMTMATNTTRTFIVTYTSATALTIQSIGVGTIS
ncbi:MAG: hypothetical protein ACYCQK_01425 [Acidiferrobacteraceae bacterium]